MSSRHTRWMCVTRYQAVSRIHYAPRFIVVTFYVDFYSHGFWSVMLRRFVLERSQKLEGFPDFRQKNTKLISPSSRRPLMCVNVCDGPNLFHISVLLSVSRALQGLNFLLSSSLLWLAFSPSLCLSPSSSSQGRLLQMLPVKKSSCQASAGL